VVGFSDPLFLFIPGMGGHDSGDFANRSAKEKETLIGWGRA